MQRPAPKRDLTGPELPVKILHAQAKDRSFPRKGDGQSLLLSQPHLYILNGVLRFDSKQVLDTGNYPTILDARYVKKAGDTMTGALTINYNTYPQLKINNGGGGYSIIRFQSGGIDKIAVGYSTTVGALLQNNENANNYINIKSGNLLWNNTFKFWHAGNDGSGSGLDADLLDGYHVGSLVHLGTHGSFNDQAGFLIIRVSTSEGTPSTYGSIFQWGSRPDVTPSTSSTDNWYNQLYGSTNQRLYFRTRTNGSSSWTSWRTLAYTTDNVASATKLQTPRTIWGQSFDGTANVTGALTGVTNITASGTIGAHGLNIFNSDSSYRMNANFSGNIVRIYNTTNDGSSTGVLYIGSTGGSALNISSTYNVGIGTTSPSYKLHVAGHVYSTNYFFTDRWFQNNNSNYGLYNYAIDARWFANSNGWNTDKSIVPTTNNARNLGVSSLRWSNIYSVLGNFSGAVTMSSTLTVSGASTLGSTLSVAGRSTLSGGITVGYSNTSYSISTSSFICQSWVRTGGNTGWYNETYGGGMYMVDSTYVRVSHSKQLYVANNIVATGEITAYSSSDIRLKTNLKELKAINTLRKINTFEYDWTEEALSLKTNKNKHDYGIIAQELIEIIPEAVSTNMYDKGYYGIDYVKLIPFTISAIKEVDDEVTILKNRVKELEERLSKYESNIK